MAKDLNNITKEAQENSINVHAIAWPLLRMQRCSRLPLSHCYRTRQSSIFPDPKKTTKLWSRQKTAEDQNPVSISSIDQYAEGNWFACCLLGQIHFTYTKNLQSCWNFQNCNKIIKCYSKQLWQVAKRLLHSCSPERLTGVQLGWNRWCSRAERWWLLDCNRGAHHSHRSPHENIPVKHEKQ